MAYTKDSLQRLFQSKFNPSKWQMMLQDYFHADKVRWSPEALDEDDEERKGYFLGSTTTKDGYKLGFFYYEMEDGSVLRRKVGLRNLIRPYLGYGFDAALAVFDDGNNWRLSLICDLKGDATNAKRFTYVFGDSKAYYKTPVARFADLQKKADEFQEIKNAFSVEALSDDFFDEYRKQYAEFVRFLTGKTYVKKGNKWVEQEVGEPDAQFFSSFGADGKLVRDYIKKMMGRLVFLYFLQSKGWLGGNLHYMHDLFYDSSDEVKADFLDKVLEPMFFGLLNTKPEDRGTAPLVNGVGVKYIPQATEIPYLNGGLFQQEEIDEVDSRFPASMFQSLFDFFDSYNFTIDENDPNDAEVGVDPEMLGKIFENLLEDNKDKGAFYTPKEIVRYMCQESLIAYLQTNIEDEDVKQHIANFVKNNDVEELGGVSSDLALSIDQKLKDVKICDPAIGSGAFPMGLLRELYACRKAIEVFEADNAADIKRHIIQNNIYGVDIEKGAVDIARLRFWLALIIDEKEPMPLPNLDFKIMQGNSLLESFMGVDLDMTSKKVKTGKDTKKTRGVLSLGFEEEDVQKTIQDLVKSYFSITDHTLRAQRRQEIDKYVKDYIKICAAGNQEVQNAVDELEIPNSQFFLWHTYFADVFEKGGFDIVIGNPPYGANIDDLIIVYASLYPSTSHDYKDIYKYFYELGMNLLKPSMVLAYITPNTMLRQPRYGDLRRFLLDYQLMQIVDLGENIFEDAIVPVNVVLLRKCSKKGIVKFANLVRCANRNNLASILSSINYYGISQDLYKETPNNIYTDDYQKAKNKEILLSEVLDFKDAGINYQRVKVGLSEKGKSDLSKRLLYQGEREDENDVEFWKGVDINSYYISEITNRFCRPNIELRANERVILNDSYFAITPKLLWRQTAPHTICAIDYTGIWFGRSIQAATIKTAYQDEMSYEFLCGVFNSKYFRFLYEKLVKETGRVFPQVKLEKLKALPIVVPKDGLIGSLVSELIAKKKNNSDTISLENQIDFLVYHLYGLTYDEVLIVDPDTPITREEYEAYKE